MAAVVSQLMVGQVLCSSSTKYTIIEFTGEGSFGKVAKCQVNSTCEIVAVKILKDEVVQNVQHELSMLSRISTLDPDHFNVVKFYEKFEYFGYTCLVFELLEKDLFQFVINDLCSSMYVHQIRPIAKQMLVALQGLQYRGVIHADIKVDNVMLANNEENSYKVKLIDFGLALPSSAARCGMKLQPIGARAPEVCLGLPFTEVIDMWGLGCMLAFLYLDYGLFPVHCEYLMMQSMVELLGMPADYQLNSGVHTKRFFSQKDDEFGSGWRLLTPVEYSAINAKGAQEWDAWRCHFKSWDDLLYIYEEEDAEEFKDRRVFIDFLKQVLHPDGEERISPTEALQHPFITMSHLGQDPDSSDYLTKAQEFMSKCKNEDIDKEQEVQLSPGQVANSCESVEVHEEPLDKFLLTPVMEDVPIPAPKRFRNVWKFFSRIQKTFLGCFFPSVQE